ncbi:SDR family NAD(P)-dependent oxidoreductase [Bradyrhizobium sp. Ash2021]|uniref:SDR family NAD(P)-dependent oxidoreductase n=1 Tax=Bradyrhizobium sp. Ash2021 TaxID=2954771 RepID=UPI0028164C4E|nr:SDR family NAD(P)-dependent oxidoreductase [Bradyrhizobium sp. Ash2021]WMT76427.1 SDR family NAD(P)-dependent oxidoreductase [Bradyrhizobium sp. Ash2021]
MDLGLKDQSAIVCASSRGLGEACATALSREGVRVYINGRNQATLEEAAARIETASGRRPHAVVADISTISGTI